jgi:hypothetical protein
MKSFATFLDLLGKIEDPRHAEGLLSISRLFASGLLVHYQLPFRFSGKINKLTFSVDPPKLSPEDEKRLMEAAEKASDGQ